MRCIRDNLAAYLQQPRDAIILIPGACPKLPPPLASYSKPSAQSGVVIDENDKSWIVVLSKSELRCLIEYYAKVRPLAPARTFLTWDTRWCQAGNPTASPRP